ncbi:SPFH domain-containing protein [Piscinibacter koreensis]|uniref:SPFH domain-containing protein n=1 Tax=Piscinibacter koreensis TaxID=2742824 RepID=A0A7Y6NLK5_9BURK|nr:SPFH domain-containing protein [Schlegelella koreensis]NUZ05397.1 SPFH domain-containing protein [Schlegelella koreensis]
MANQETRERTITSGNGFVYLGIGVLALLACVLFTMSRAGGLAGLATLVLAVLVAAWCFLGLYMLQPNQAALLMFFGSYRGTDRSEGLRWANPFYAKTKISVRARNFNSEKLKVNDLRGNPIEIAATVVWRVDDTARASFDVENYEGYVLTQTESGLRHLALSYAYDNFDDLGTTDKAEVTLRSGTEEVSIALGRELQQRFDQAGIVVVDAKLTHLAYAPEIAGTMLRRQQAEAVIAARAKIVAGAVGMVELALNGLAERGVIELDGERRAAMVSNLLVVLCSDHDATPVVNAGLQG